MSVDAEQLSGDWSREWPDSPPIGHLLRRRMPDRWVRFHSLPRGRRNPLGADDYDEVLRRYNSVLAAMLGESGGDAVYLVTVTYGADDGAAGTEPVVVGLHPGAVPWMRAVNPDDPEDAYDLHVSRTEFTPGCLDDLLRYVADDRTSGVIVADRSLQWLMHPYDGGLDVIAPSVRARDRMAARFSGWLSDRPDGL